MTYFRFHLIFNLPVLLLLAALSFGAWTHPVVVGCGLLVLVPVMIFTTPWDNYAAKHGIWGFSEGQFWRKVGHLPVEEYLFFVIQSLQAMLLTLVLLRLGDFQSDVAMSDDDRLVRLMTAGGGFLVFVVAGLFLAGRFRRWAGGRFHYTGHLLYWFLPLIGLQWWIAPEVLAPRWPVLLGVTVLLGGYLSWADWMAIRRNIWFFDHRQTTGVTIGGKMPWEEAAFFFLTSLLVAQSFLLLLPEAMRD